MSPGQIITGTVVSATVTVNEHELELFDESVTVNVCVVIPIGNKDPLAKPAVWVVETPVQLSVPIGAVKFTIAPHLFESLLTKMFPGQTMEGNCVSFTVILKEQLAMFPEPSVTV